MTTHDSSQIPSDLTPAGRRIAILASVLGSFLTPFMISAVNVALPVIGRELGLDAVLLNWVPTAFLLASSVFLLPCGRLADLWGRKAVYQWGIALFSSPNINCVMSAVAPRDYGLAAGVQSTMRVLGQMTSMAVTMLLFALLIGAVEIDAQRLPAFLQTFRLAYLIFAGLCALGILASLARGPGLPPRAAPPTVAAPPTTETAGPRAAPVLPPAGNAPASSLPSGDDHG